MSSKYTLSFFAFFALLTFSCQRNESKRMMVEMEPPAWVIDSAKVLPRDGKDLLSGSIAELKNELGSEIVLLIVDTLHGEDLNAYSHRAFIAWGVGRAKEQDGILMTVSLSDRKTRIEVGYGLEKIITDSISNQIIRDKVIPAFREAKFYEGLNTAVDEMKSVLRANKELIGQRKE